jgi:hypothetical protein
MARFIMDDDEPYYAIVGGIAVVKHALNSINYRVAVISITALFLS